MTKIPRIHRRSGADSTAESIDPRQSFCAMLRERREAAGLSIGAIARITRIPERSLQALESGAFEELPGDVFIRGFVRSYAGCVGLDAGEAIRLYSACGLTPAPVATSEARQLSEQLAVEHAPPNVTLRRKSTAGLGEPYEDDPEHHAGDGSADRAAPAEAAPVTDRATTQVDAEPEPEPEPEPERPRLILPPRFFTSSEPRSSHLTLAVLILAIVATLTMSYLMRRPGDLGDGVTESEAPAASPLG